jgi:tetratricopeptide (TPR) repeat protein
MSGMRATKFVTQALVSLFICVTCASAQAVHTLQGRVIAPNGLQPSAPVRVTLTYGGRRIYETFTDLSGRFSFSGLGRGTYELIAEGDDKTFERTSVYAEVSAYGPAPQLFTQDIQLQPLRGKATTRAAVVNAFSQAVPKDAARAFENSQKSEKQGKRDQALVQLETALKIFPAYFEAHLALGNLLLKQGKYNEAIAELDRAREINPKDERLYQSFGLIMLKQRNYAVAVAVFAEAEGLNPTNPLNPFMKAAALIHQASTIDLSNQQGVENQKRLLAKADEGLSKATELSGGSMKADNLLLSSFYEMKGDLPRAAAELEEYLRKTPGAANAGEIRAYLETLRAKINSQKRPAP